MASVRPAVPTAALSTPTWTPARKSSRSAALITTHMTASYQAAPGLYTHGRLNTQAARPSRAVRRAVVNLDQGGVPQSGTARGRVPWSAARAGRLDRRPGLR